MKWCTKGICFIKDSNEGFYHDINAMSSATFQFNQILKTKYSNTLQNNMHNHACYNTFIEDTHLGLQ